MSSATRVKHELSRTFRIKANGCEEHLQIWLVLLGNSREEQLAHDKSRFCSRKPFFSGYRAQTFGRMDASSFASRTVRNACSKRRALVKLFDANRAPSLSDVDLSLFGFLPISQHRDVGIVWKPLATVMTADFGALANIFEKSRLFDWRASLATTNLSIRTCICIPRAARSSRGSHRIPSHRLDPCTRRPRSRRDRSPLWSSRAVLAARPSQPAAAIGT